MLVTISPYQWEYRSLGSPGVLGITAAILLQHAVNRHKY